MDVQTPIEEKPDEYAHVEIFGHRSHTGRVLEADRFGAKMLRIDVPKDGDFAKGFVSHFYGGSSIFSVTPCDLAYVQRANKGREPAGMISYRSELGRENFQVADDEVDDTVFNEADDSDIPAAPEPPPGTPLCTFPLLSDIVPGDKLIADGAFTCLKEGEVCEVKHDDGGIYVECANGRHFLEGQRGHRDRCVGFDRYVEPPAPPSPAPQYADDEILF